MVSSGLQAAASQNKKAINNYDNNSKLSRHAVLFTIFCQSIALVLWLQVYYLCISISSSASAILCSVERHLTDHLSALARGPTSSSAMQCFGGGAKSLFCGFCCCFLGGWWYCIVTCFHCEHQYSCLVLFFSSCCCWVLLYGHRNCTLIRDKRPGQPPRLSHSFWALFAGYELLSFVCLVTCWQVSR